MGCLLKNIINFFSLPLTAALLIFMLVSPQSAHSQSLVEYDVNAASGLRINIERVILGYESQLAIAIPAYLKQNTQSQKQGEVANRQLSSGLVLLNDAIGCLDKVIGGIGGCNSTEVIPSLLRARANNSAVRSIIENGITIFLDGNDLTAMLSANTGTAAELTDALEFTEALGETPPADYVPILTVDGFGTSCLMDFIPSTAKEASDQGREIACCYNSSGTAATFKGHCQFDACLETYGSCTIPSGQILCDFSCLN